MKNTPLIFLTAFFLFSSVISLANRPNHSIEPTLASDPGDSTDLLAAMVRDAAAEIRMKGEKAFDMFRVRGSRWNRGERYVFILDPMGNMILHPELEGKNQMDLTDINGKPVIRGLIDAATAHPSKPEGWYHYQWPVPGGLLPRWKSSFVKKVVAPSGKTYIVGSGVYNDRMERAFVEDLVKDAVAAAAGAVEVAIETVLARPPMQLRESHRLAEQALAAVSSVTGEPATAGAAPHWTVAALHALAGTPAVVYGPSVEAGSNEPGWVSTDAIRQGAAGLAALATTFCAPR